MMKTKIIFWCMAAHGKEGISGGDRIAIEFARRWSIKNEVIIYLWEEGLAMFKRFNLGLPAIYKVLSLKSVANLGFIVCYFSRIIRASLEAIKLSLVSYKEDSGKIILYSASDFLMDVLPAVILKLRFPKYIWVSGWYQTAPNPIRGFAEGNRKNKYYSSAFLYWFSQQLTKPFVSWLADIILVNNEAEKNRFPKQNLQKKVLVVIGAIDLSSIQNWQKNHKKIAKEYDAVFQGRFHPQKGVVELIEIWNIVTKKFPKAKLAMIGNGPLMDEVVQKINHHGLRNNIKLLGFVYEGPEKYKVFAQSKIVVHPAFYDSGGMASAEAMAFGLPCVGFDLISYKSYYPKGMLKVETGNINKFAEEIIKLLEDTKLRQKTGKEAVELIEHGWSWDFRAEEILSGITR